MPQIAPTLPAPTPAVQAWRAAATPVGARTLLLVEDSRQAAEVVRLLARRLGIRLRRAEHLLAARQHLRVYRPDVALIDLGLPDGSGLDLIAELDARQPPLRRIVALSADPTLREPALAAGACAFVPKPLCLPADLPALLGPGAVPAGAAVLDAPLADPAAGRNAGADPMALRDDLTHARSVLERSGPAGLAYAARFVAGIARCTADPDLEAVANRAARSGDIAALIAALVARTEAAHRLQPI